MRSYGPPMRRTAFGCLGFVLFGLGTEIAFTGLWAGIDGSFRGAVSLCMVPVYALAYAAGRPLLTRLRTHGLDRLAVTLPATVLLIYGIEYLSGSAYAALGLVPWHYEHGWASDFSSGHVTLLYLPFWAAFAAILPFVIDRIDIAARALARGDPSPGDDRAGRTGAPGS